MALGSFFAFNNYVWMTMFYTSLHFRGSTITRFHSTVQLSPLTLALSFTDFGWICFRGSLRRQNHVYIRNSFCTFGLVAGRYYLILYTTKISKCKSKRWRILTGCLTQLVNDSVQAPAFVYEIIQSCKIIFLGHPAELFFMLHFPVLLSFSFGINDQYICATGSFVLRFCLTAWTPLIQ